MKVGLIDVDGHNFQRVLEKFNSLLDEWCRHGEVCVCTKCGWLYNCYDDKVCPNCGTVHVDSI